MAETLIFIPTEQDAGLRVDKFITEKMQDFTRSAVVRLIEEDRVTVDGKTVNKNYKCCEKDEIAVCIPDMLPLEIISQNIPLDIVFEDEDLLVVNKPKGMVVHPAAGNYEGTLVNALLYHYGNSLSIINGVNRPGIVHRIDKDTSGLLIVAKNDFSHMHLAQQIKEHSFHRVYEAVVHGHMKNDKGTVDAPIGRNPSHRKKMAVTYKNSKNAITHYSVLSWYEEFTHIMCKLETGRTHQIRVHMASIGYPIAGDMVYGPKKGIKALDGQCLHAKEIGFVHPRSGEYLNFTSPLPIYFEDFLSKLKRK